MHQPDPTEVLRSLVQRVRAGGVVAFQEMNPLSDGLVSNGPTPLWDQARGWMHRVITGAGIETEMGYRIHGALSEAGLPTPRMESNAPVDGGPGMEAHTYFVETLRSLMPLAEKLGIVTAEEAGLDTLAERLLEEVVATGAVLKMPDAVSAFANKM